MILKKEKNSSFKGKIKRKQKKINMIGYQR